MQNVMNALFQSVKEEGTLPNTTFEAKDIAVNPLLAKSLLTLADSHFSKGKVKAAPVSAAAEGTSTLLEHAREFKKGTVELSLYLNTIDGYVYEEGNVLLCVVPTKNERNIEKIYSNVSVEQTLPIAKKALLYFDIYKDATGLGVRHLVTTLSTDELTTLLETRIIPTLLSNLSSSIEQEELELMDTDDLSHAFAGLDASQAVQTPAENIEQSGYVFQKGSVVVFIGEQNHVLVNQPEERIREEIIQAMMLTEIAENRTGMNLKEPINTLLNAGILSLDTPQTTELVRILAALDIHFFQTYQLIPQSVTVEEELAIVSREEEGNPYITRVEMEQPIPTPVKEMIKPIIDLTEEEFGSVGQLSFLEEEETKPPSNRLEAIAARIKAAASRGFKLQEIADLTDDGDGKPVSKGTISKVQNSKHGNVQEKTLQKIEQALDKLESGTVNMPLVETQRENETTGEVKPMAVQQPTAQPIQQPIIQPIVQPVRMSEPVPTLEEIKKERPLVFDDDAVRAKLFTYDLSDMLPVGSIRTMNDFVEAVIEFRRRQRVSEVPQEALLDIEKKMVYVGDVEPIFIGLMNMMQGIHVLYTGPAGAGKTVIAQTISAILNMPLYTMNGNVDTDTDMILGSKEASNGSTYSVRGLLVKALENAGIFYGDEVNFILNEILSVMNPALDDRGEVHNPNTHEKVVGHENFRFIGSMNVGYQGTRELNEATNDRFVCVDVDYMPIETLKEYIENFDPGYTEFQRTVLKMNEMSQADVHLIADIAQALQQGARTPDSGLPQEVGSIRNINQIIRQSRNLPMHLAVGTVIRKYRDPQEQAAIKGVLQSVNRLDLSKLRLNASDLING